MKLLFITVAILVGVGSAQQPAKAPKATTSAKSAPKATAVSPEMKAIADSERAFAKLGAATSVRESFPQYFAQDGVIFNPHPVNLQETFAKRPMPAKPPRGILNWQPEYGDVAASGELGYDTGPSWVVDREGKEPTTYGDFFSLWKKQADGSYKVIVDMGTQTPDKREPKEFWQASPSGWKASAKAKADPAKEEAAINAAEKQFRAVSAKSGLRAALTQFGDPSLRVWKNGFSPTMDRKQSVMESAPFKEKGEPMKTEVAKSGDMGYDYGKWESVEGPDKGYYLHVWRKNAAGAWKIVARVEHVLKPQ